MAAMIKVAGSGNSKSPINNKIASSHAHFPLLVSQLMVPDCEKISINESPHIKKVSNTSPANPRKTSKSRIGLKIKVKPIYPKDWNWTNHFNAMLF